MTTVEKEEKEIQEEKEQRKREEAERLKKIEKEEHEKVAAAKRQEKKQRTKEKVEKRLEEYRQKKETKLFSSHFHLSRAGMEYYKNNNIEPPSEEVLQRMQQRLARTRREQADGPLAEPSHQSMDKQQENAQTSKHEDNPVVPLEPEENMNNVSMSRSKQLKSQSLQDEAQIKANEVSLYKQEQEYLRQLEQEKILKAEEHHVVKTKDFDVYGRLRTEKPFVKATVKSQVPSELNEKFITTECITDRRVKISSMANRQYINAPSVEDVRKQGQHQMILQAINKKQTFSELINQANAMVTSVLHDNLKRSVNILPSVCRFGPIVENSESELTVTIKNEDGLSQRIQIKPTQDKRIVIKQEVYGPIAPGMTKKLIVTIRAGAVSEGKTQIKEEVQIMTKSDIFKLGIEAEVVTQQEFDQLQRKTTNSRVRSRLHDSLNFSKAGVMAKFKEETQKEQASLKQSQELGMDGGLRSTSDGQRLENEEAQQHSQM